MSYTRQPPPSLLHAYAPPAACSVEPEFEQQHGNAAMAALVAGHHAPATPAVEELMGPPSPAKDVLALARGRDTSESENVRAIQLRLTELNYPVVLTGEYDEQTRAAIKQFQVEHADEIHQVVEDSRDPAFDNRNRDFYLPYSRRAGAEDKELMNAGVFDPLHPSTHPTFIEHPVLGRVHANDATHQVLASTWRGAGGTEGRRRINGELMTESETFDYLTGQMAKNKVPYSEGQVNVLGTRGLQGGVHHANDGAMTTDNRYDDTYFVLTRGEDGKGRVQTFRGTVDPGVEGVPQAPAGAQGDLHLQMQPSLHGRNYSRPSLTGANFGISSGGGGQGDLKQPTGDQAGVDTWGRQAVHGAWYGHFINSLRRGLDESTNDGQLPDEGLIRYTLLDANAMSAPPRR